MSKPLEPRSIKDYARLIQAVDSLEDMTAIQCSDGNWNYNSYMHGMANGMLFALSMFQGGDPGYLDSPKEWLQNTSYDDIKPEKANE